MVYQSTKLVMRKILVTLSPGNVLNMALESPKLLYHLLQFMNNQIIPLLLENLALFARILSEPIMLIYHCANPSCSNVCDLSATCSGFVNHRENARARALSTRVWHCHLHSSPSAILHPSLSPDNSPPRPIPPSLKSLLNQGLSLADAKNSKEKCAKCSAALCSNTVPVRYSVCSRDSIRNAALDQKLQLMTTIGNVKSALTFNRTVRLSLQIFCSLDLPTHFLPNLYLLLTSQNK